MFARQTPPTSYAEFEDFQREFCRTSSRFTGLSHRTDQRMHIAVPREKRSRLEPYSSLHLFDALEHGRAATSQELVQFQDTCNR